MHSYYAKVPASQMQRQIDGRDYAMTRYAIGEMGTLTANTMMTVNADRMMRVCFITNGEAYILLGRRGDAIALTCTMPADVLDFHTADAFAPECEL